MNHDKLLKLYWKNRIKSKSDNHFSHRCINCGHDLDLKFNNEIKAKD